MAGRVSGFIALTIIPLAKAFVRPMAERKRDADIKN
jgi:hypothetical protein